MIKKDLKVALVHDSLVQYGGAEKTLKVLADMFPESPIYTSIYDKEKFQSHFSANRIRTSRLQNFPGFIKKRYKFLLPFLPTVFEEFDFTDFDLVISSSSSFAKGIVLPVHALHINYCHTPTRFLWDSTHTYLKAQRLIFPFNLIARGLLHKTRIWDRAAAERVDHFIANSKNTARRISKYYRKDSVIIHPPIEVKKTQMKSEHADFFLIVSRLEKYKHIDIAVKAFNQLPKRKLIIIGDGSQKNKLQQIARDNIQFLGYKNDEVTREYYKNCRAFIATSKDEDFGMTPLEAMAAGKPILALKSGGYTESVIPGITGTFFDECTPESLLSGLKDLLKHEENFSAETIRKHALTFDTEIFKKKMTQYITTILETK